MTTTDEDLHKLLKEMDAVEDTLMDSGFSEEQWVLIKQYMLLAINYSQLSIHKTMRERVETDTVINP
jgi:hypothetical protein